MNNAAKTSKTKASKMVVYRYAKIAMKDNIFNLNGTVVKVKDLKDGSYCAEMAAIKSEIPDYARDFFQHMPEDCIHFLTTQELTDYLSRRYSF